MLLILKPLETLCQAVMEPLHAPPRRCFTTPPHSFPETPTPPSKEEETTRKPKPEAGGTSAISQSSPRSIWRIPSSARRPEHKRAMMINVMATTSISTVTRPASPTPTKPARPSSPNTNNCMRSDHGRNDFRGSEDFRARSTKPLTA